MGDARIKVLLTDDKTALKNALTAIYPTVPQLLCLWHINKNVLTRAQKAFATHPEFSAETNKRNKKYREEFMGDWDAVCYT